MDIGIPEKIQFNDLGSRIEIARRWFGWETLLATGIAIFWDSVIFTWYGSVSSQTPAFVVYLPILHVVVGFLITYYALASWINQTHIEASQQRIRVRHGPLPWIGGKEIDAYDVKQLYAKSKHSWFRFRVSFSSSDPDFEVRAITKRGKNVKVVGGLTTQEQAIFVEQQLEKFLRIEDAPVPGEISKPQV